MIFKQEMQSISVNKRKANQKYIESIFNMYFGNDQKV